MYTKEQRYSTSHVRRGADSMEVVGVPVVTSTHWIGLNTTPSNVTFGPVDFMVPHHFIPILRPPGTIANRVFAVFRMVSHSPSTVRNCDSLIQKFPNLLLDESSLHRFCGCRCTHADTECTPAAPHSSSRGSFHSATPTLKIGWEPFPTFVQSDPGLLTSLSSVFCMTNSEKSGH